MTAASAEIIRIEKPGPPAIVAELAPIVTTAHAFGVADIATHGTALDRIRQLRAAEKAIEDHFAGAKKSAHDAHKAIVAAVAGLVGPIAEARAIYDRKASTYEAEQKRIAAAKQREIEAEARRHEEERQLLDAIAAEDAGDTQQADAIMSETVSVPVITVAPEVATVAGVTTQTRWSAEITNLHALVVYVAAHPEWITLLDANMPNLNRLAVSQRDAMALPGVRAVSRQVRATR